MLSYNYIRTFVRSSCAPTRKRISSMTREPNASIATIESEKRKRGGQPGNINAIKHGFYSKNFSLAERRGLKVTEGVVLGDEIALLRVLIRRSS